MFSCGLATALPGKGQSHPPHLQTRTERPWHLHRQCRKGPALLCAVSLWARPSGSPPAWVKGTAWLVAWGRSRGDFPSPHPALWPVCVLSHSVVSDSL